jgi:hypothetical protein
MEAESSRVGIESTTKDRTRDLTPSGSNSHRSHFLIDTTRTPTVKPIFHTVLVFRAPTTLSETIGELAAERQISLSAMIRELLIAGLRAQHSTIVPSARP